MNSLLLLNWCAYINQSTLKILEEISDDQSELFLSDYKFDESLRERLDRLKHNLDNYKLYLTPSCRKAVYDANRKHNSFLYYVSYYRGNPDRQMAKDAHRAAYNMVNKSHSRRV